MSAMRVWISAFFIKKDIRVAVSSRNADVHFAVSFFIKKAGAFQTSFQYFKTCPRRGKRKKLQF
jgi:hypothetical protein